MENKALHKNRIDSLQSLLQKNYDAEAGYKQAMTLVENQALKDWLKQQAAQRNRFATELDEELRTLNVEPRESGSFLGDMHRGWIDLKTATSSNTAEAVLEECIRGEQASVKEYENQVALLFNHASTHGLIRCQLSSIKSALETAKRLEGMVD